MSSESSTTRSPKEVTTKMEVLLLDVGYQPLQAITARRAVRLLAADKVEVLEISDLVMHSAKAVLPLPSVLRLRYSIAIPYRARVPLNRRAVLQRDQHRCAYCGRRASTIDHVVPRSRGGKHRWENVVASCGSCNAKKDDRLLSEIGWGLPFEPHAPTGVRWTITVPIQPAWGPYLGMEPALS